MVARNTQPNLVYGAWANVVHTAVNGVKSMGNGVKSLENGMKSPGNAVNTREIPGHFSSIYIKQEPKKSVLAKLLPQF